MNNLLIAKIHSDGVQCILGVLFLVINYSINSLYFTHKSLKLSQENPNPSPKMLETQAQAVQTSTSLYDVLSNMSEGVFIPVLNSFYSFFLLT